jgi:hypothetical protein
VEGETELGAIESVVGTNGQIRVVNLRGQVIARKGGLSFTDELKNDIAEGVFSFVSIDGDLHSNIRTVRRAAETDGICGAFFISKPDFEFGNFSLDELLTVMGTSADEFSMDSGYTDDMRQRLTQAESGSALREKAKRYFPKGEQWGRKLMAYAIDHPEWIDPLTGASVKRPILQALDQVLRATFSNHADHRKLYRTDSFSGQPVRR